MLQRKLCNIEWIKKSESNTGISNEVFFFSPTNKRKTLTKGKNFIVPCLIYRCGFCYQENGWCGQAQCNYQHQWWCDNHQNRKYLQKYRDLFQAGWRVWWDYSRWQKNKGEFKTSTFQMHLSKRVWEHKDGVVILTSSVEMLPSKVRVLWMLCASVLFGYGNSLLFSPEHPDETAMLWFFSLAECHNPRQRHTEPGAEVGWKRNYH